MIQSFKDADAERLLTTGQSWRIPANIRRVALRKLMQLAAARNLHELRIPPNNRLELLRGDRKGQHSIRINDQWRICFVWQDGHACDVEVVDYH